MSETYGGFVTALINELAVRLSKVPLAGREEWFIAWAREEGTAAQYNLLATTWTMPGSTDFNSAGVQNYRDLESGVTATANTLLEGGRVGYGYVVITDAAFNPDATFEDFRDGVSRAAWSGLPRDGEHYLIPDPDPSWAALPLPMS